MHLRFRPQVEALPRLGDGMSTASTGAPTAPVAGPKAVQAAVSLAILSLVFARAVSVF